MPQLLQLFGNQLLIQFLISVFLSLLIAFLKIPILFLQGLHTYIHPDSVPDQRNGGVKAAIRRPSTGNDLQSEIRKRTSGKPKGKDHNEFDESTSQIFRLKLDEGHLQTRLFFDDYRYCFIYSSLAWSTMAVHRFLHHRDTEFGDVFPIVPSILGFVTLTKTLVSLGKCSVEKSASRKSEKQLSLLLGFLGFACGLPICFGACSSILDFESSDTDAVFSRVLFAILMGILAGFLYVPAVKNAKSFWIGTDQFRSNLDIIPCGRTGRFILYTNLLVGIVSVLLWVTPVSSNFPQLEELGFRKIRVLGLLIAGAMQLIGLRSNLQMYLNEALLSWYQRLHASKVPDLAFSRAKVFLPNHYLCVAVIQFLGPPLLVLGFLGLFQIEGSSSVGFAMIPCSSFLKEMCLVMGWWVLFVWEAVTLAHLWLYRYGILYIS